MVFSPKVNDKLKIGPETYTITEHPAAKGMPYGQAGRRATVYQLSTTRNEFRALKVFNAIYRTDDTRVQAEKLSKYAMLPGMIACKRIVLSPIQYPDLRNRLKSLQYAVIMPWVEGTTWQELIMSKEVLDKNQCLALADGFLQTMVNMEDKGIAHCDLSGPNLIVDLVGLRSLNGSKSRFQPSLIDLEELYAPDFVQPKKLPAGSAGYAHKTVKNGIWTVDADRFAGAILLSNILTWHYKPMLEESFGEQFFDPDEIHQSCKRQELMSHALKSQYGEDLQELFEHAWNSETLDECPPFSDWARALDIDIEEISDVPTAHKQTVEIPETPLPPSTTQKPPIAQPLGGPVTGWVSLMPQQGIDSIPAPQPAKPKPRPEQENFWEWDTPQFDPNKPKSYSIDYSPSSSTIGQQGPSTAIPNPTPPPYPPPQPPRNRGQNIGYKYPPPINQQKSNTSPTRPANTQQQKQGMTDSQVAALVFLIIVVLIIIGVIIANSL
jgi:hypothetical protein